MPIHCQLHDKSDHKVLLYSDVAVVSGEQKQSCMLCPESFWISWTMRGRPRSQRKRNERRKRSMSSLTGWMRSGKRLQCQSFWSHTKPLCTWPVTFFAQPAENLESHAHLGCTSSSSNAGFRFIQRVQHLIYFIISRCLGLVGVCVVTYFSHFCKPRFRSGHGDFRIVLAATGCGGGCGNVRLMMHAESSQSEISIVWDLRLLICSWDEASHST